MICDFYVSIRLNYSAIGFIHQPERWIVSHAHTNKRTRTHAEVDKLSFKLTPRQPFFPTDFEGVARPERHATSAGFRLFFGALSRFVLRNYTKGYTLG